MKFEFTFSDFYKSMIMIDKLFSTAKLLIEFKRQNVDNKSDKKVRILKEIVTEVKDRETSSRCQVVKKGSHSIST